MFSEKLMLAVFIIHQVLYLNHKFIPHYSYSIVNNLHLIYIGIFAILNNKNF